VEELVSLPCYEWAGPASSGQGSRPRDRLRRMAALTGCRWHRVNLRHARTFPTSRRSVSNILFRGDPDKMAAWARTRRGCAGCEQQRHRRQIEDGDKRQSEQAAWVEVTLSTRPAALATIFGMCRQRLNATRAPLLLSCPLNRLHGRTVSVRFSHVFRACLVVPYWIFLQQGESRGAETI
jgi:hypothetical protein